jgi:hypothetical protein
MEGQAFGRWTALSESPRRGACRNLRYWLCRCECGTVKEVEGVSLRQGRSTSCGCFAREVTMAVNRTHGHTAGHGPTAEYRCWRHILGRCYNPSVQSFPQYGGRGIEVCPRWRSSFENFLADVGPRPSPRHSIDRIDFNGHYEPQNVRWATAKRQANNTSRNHYISAFGERKTLQQWSEYHGIQGPTIRKRLRLGWSPERAVSEPLRATSSSPSSACRLP